jgi:hypothetical protein
MLIPNAGLRHSSNAHPYVQHSGMKSHGAELSREPCHKLPTQNELYETSRHDCRCKFERRKDKIPFVFRKLQQLVI